MMDAIKLHDKTSELRATLETTTIDGWGIVGFRSPTKPLRCTPALSWMHLGVNRILVDGRAFPGVYAPSGAPINEFCILTPIS
jgi:hypothetical protein